MRREGVSIVSYASITTVFHLIINEDQRTRGCHEYCSVWAVRRQSSGRRLLLYHIDWKRSPRETCQWRCSLPWLELEDARTMQRSHVDTLLHTVFLVGKLQSSLPWFIASNLVGRTRSSPKHRRKRSPWSYLSIDVNCGLGRVSQLAYEANT